MRGRAGVTLPMLLLSGCALLSERTISTDKIRDAESAITIAKRECKEYGKPPGSWIAELHRGTWDVGFWPDTFTHGHDVALFQIHILAKDGTSDACKLWIRAD